MQKLSEQEHKTPLTCRFSLFFELHAENVFALLVLKSRRPRRIKQV